MFRSSRPALFGGRVLRGAASARRSSSSFTLSRSHESRSRHNSRDRRGMTPSTSVILEDRGSRNPRNPDFSGFDWIYNKSSCRLEEIIIATMQSKLTGDLLKLGNRLILSQNSLNFSSREQISILAAKGASDLWTSELLHRHVQMLRISIKVKGMLLLQDPDKSMIGAAASEHLHNVNIVESSQFVASPFCYGS